MGLNQKPKPKPKRKPTPVGAVCQDPASAAGQAPTVGPNPERAARCLQAIGHPLRLLIIRSLRNGEQSVNHLVDVTGAGQANVSQHLRVMRDRQILAARKDGNNVLYHVADPRVFAIIDAVQEVFCKHD